MKSEQIVGIADKLYQARRNLKSLFPDKYEEWTKEWKMGIQLIHEKKGIPILEILMDALKMMQKEDVHGMTQMVVMAAAVDLIEPE